MVTEKIVNTIQKKGYKYSRIIKSDRVLEKAQEIVLCGLSHAGIFNKAVFYGGIALRR